MVMAARRSPDISPYLDMSGSGNVMNNVMNIEVAKAYVSETPEGFGLDRLSDYGDTMLDEWATHRAAFLDTVT